MQNEPNFQKSQMVVTLVLTTNYNEKQTMDTWSKQTQSKPNFGLLSFWFLFIMGIKLRQII
jgi:hypothetical protein